MTAVMFGCLESDSNRAKRSIIPFHLSVRAGFNA